MTEMHQIVVLTTHPVSQDGLRRIYEAANDDSLPKELRRDDVHCAVAFKLADTVEIPDDELSGLPAPMPQHLIPIYGELAP